MTPAGWWRLHLEIVNSKGPNIKMPTLRTHQKNQPLPASSHCFCFVSICARNLSTMAEEKLREKPADIVSTRTSSLYILTTWTPQEGERMAQSYKIEKGHQFTYSCCRAERRAPYLPALGELLKALLGKEEALNHIRMFTMA